MGATVTDKATRKVHIQWVRSGIGFTRHQKKIVRSLGLLRLNQVVTRPDTPQIRGLVESVPHLVKIVSAPERPAWLSVPEYTILAPLPKEPSARKLKKAAAEGEPSAATVGAAAGGGEGTEKKAKAEPEKTAFKGATRAKKPPKAAAGKSKTTKGGDAKKSKATEKSSKAAKKTKK
jgi:large subunit ribosomal protein L30